MLRSLPALLAVTLLLPSSLDAQTSKPAPINTDYIPAEMAAAVVVCPRRALSASEMEIFPTELASAGCLQEFGFDILEVEQLVGVLLPKPDQSPDAGLILRFTQPVDADKLFAKLLVGAKPAAAQGKSYRQAAKPDQPSLFVSSDRKLALLALEPVLLRMMSAQKVDSPLTRLLKSCDDSSDLLAVVAIDPLREQLMKELAGEQAPPKELAELKRVPELLSTLEARLNLRPGLKNELVARGRDEKSAIELARILQMSLEFAKQQILSDVQKRGGDPKDPVNQAAIRYSRRIADHLMSQMRPVRQGERLTFVSESAVGAVEASVLAGLLLPAVQAARQAADRTRSMNGLRQIALAMLSHEVARRQLPPRAMTDKQGKPLLSWRVQILPYLEQQALYDKFKLDEPWDSPHNRELIRQMPAIYGDSPEGQTNLLVPVAKGTIFGEADGMSLAKIRDGTSNTILAVEVDDARAVPWTKPADLEVNLENPSAGLGALRPGGFNVVFADGHVEFLKNTIKPAVLRAIFTASGGEAVSLESVNE